jgi:hypothetical protein
MRGGREEGKEEGVKRDDTLERGLRRRWPVVHGHAVNVRADPYAWGGAAESRLRGWQSGRNTGSWARGARVSIGSGGEAVMSHDSSRHRGVSPWVWVLCQVGLGDEGTGD